MKKIKKPISILLVFMMIVSLFAVVPFTASAATTGKFGEGLTWNIDDDGTLTFSGSGSIPMDGFRENGDVKKVIINDSVTELGSYAFYKCSNLTEVDIQNPTALIGKSYHFAYSSVTTVTLPEGMTTIPRAMFRGCDALTTVDLPSTITSIGDVAFMDSGLQSISVPEGVTTIPENMCRGCGALTTVDLPSTITSIEKWAFMDSGLQSISVPLGATYDRTSFQTSSLQSVTFEGRSPMTFTGGEFTFLSDAATVYIPEGST